MMAVPPSQLSGRQTDRKDFNRIKNPIMQRVFFIVHLIALSGRSGKRQMHAAGETQGRDKKNRQGCLALPVRFIKLTLVNHASRPA